MNCKFRMELQRLDPYSILLTKALVCSVVFHIFLLGSIHFFGDVGESEPVLVVPVDISQLIFQPNINSDTKSFESSPKVEGAKIQKRESLHRISSERSKVQVDQQDDQQFSQQSNKPFKQIRQLAKVSEPRNLGEAPSVGAVHELDGKGAYEVVPFGGIEAQPIEQVQPEIPEELKSGEYKSYVRVKVEISKNGTSFATLRTSSGNQEVDNRVLSAIRRWKWRPALIDGRKIDSVRYFKFEFEVSNH